MDESHITALSSFNKLILVSTSSNKSILFGPKLPQFEVYKPFKTSDSPSQAKEPVLAPSPLPYLLHQRCLETVHSLTIGRPLNASVSYQGRLYSDASPTALQRRCYDKQLNL